MRSSKIGSEDLTNETWLQILHNVADIATLANVLHASPRACKAFDLEGYKIIENLFVDETLCRHTQRLFRSCVLIRANKLPFDNLDEFYYSAIHNALSYSTAFYELELFYLANWMLLLIRKSFAASWKQQVYLTVSPSDAWSTR